MWDVPYILDRSQSRTEGHCLFTGVKVFTGVKARSHLEELSWGTDSTLD